MALRTLTMGSFDLAHPGHLDLLTKCRALAGTDELTVAVNTDEFITRFKRPPVFSTQDRVAMIAALKPVDRVIVNDGTNQLALIASTGCELIVIGSDWAPPRDYLAQIAVTQEQLDYMGISVCYASRPPNWWSTTRIRSVVTGSATATTRASNGSC